MDRPQECTVEVQGDIAAELDRPPGLPADAASEAMFAALEDFENRRIAACPHCASAALQRWGKGRAKVQRWRCRSCERSFSSTTGTLLAGLHAPGKLRLVLIDMLSSEPSSCRSLAGTLTLSAMTIWGWRQRVNQVLERIVADQHEHRGTAPVTVDTVVLRESRKASREWVDHQRDPASHPEPDRHRWVEYREWPLPLPKPMTPHLVAAQLTQDRFGTCHAALLPNLPAHFDASPTRAEVLAEQVSLAPFATAVQPAEQYASDSEALHDRFRSFLRPFSGPAKKHLGGYVAWFVAWGARSSEARQLDMVGRAWRALTTPRPTQFWT